MNLTTRFLRSLRVLSFFGLVLMFTMPANAQLIVQLDSPSLTTSPGSTISFIGTLTNTGSTELFLNEFDYDFGPAGGFFSGDIGANVPLSLAGNTSFSGSLFVIGVGGATPLKPYTIGVSIAGGPNDQATNSLATNNLLVNVSSPTASIAPEPGSLALLVPIMGTLSAVGLVIRKRRGHD